MNIDVTKAFKNLMDSESDRITILEGSSRCFAFDQEVVTNKGTKKISEIEIGDKVLSFNENTKSNEFKLVKGLHQFKNDKKCLKITLKNGTVIKCTEDHEFYYEGAWISIKHLLSLRNDKLKNKNHGILNLDDILLVEEIELEEVYDIAVEDNSNYYLANQDDKILVHNSGKTYAVCQYLIAYCLKNTGKIITIARDNLVVNKRTVFLDFMQILKQFGVRYDLNKSEMVVTINSNIVRFVGLDDSSKVHGMKQDVVYVNEGLTISQDIYLQLLQRTTERMIIDYNPSRAVHFLYDWAENREGCNLYKYTIFDNPLAPVAAVKQILSYEPTEENIRQRTASEFHWRVYGLGERFKGNDVVIRQYYRYSEPLDEKDIEWKYYGGDFGWTQPSALVEVSKLKNSKKLYCRVVMYESGLTNIDIANRIKENPLIDKSCLQIWDSAEPKSITELRLNDINAIKATKGAGSIYYGIQKMQQFELYIYNDKLSDKLAYELENLRYLTDTNGDLILDAKNNPVLKAGGDHICDGVRMILNKFVNL